MRDQISLTATLKLPGRAFLFLVAVALFNSTISPGFGQISVEISNSAAGIHLLVPSTIPSTQIYPEYSVQTSQDLLNWQPAGGKVQGINGLSAAVLDIALPFPAAQGFYRISLSTNSLATNQTAAGGADIYGYNDLFAQQVAALQSMSIMDFAADYPPPPYLPRLDWDPTTAGYWTNFDSQTNFQLNSQEFAIFQTNGFVVSERLGSATFAQTYYKILSSDLPVFISADSILHAWHLTFNNILEELEESDLSPLAEDVVTNMAAQIPQAEALFGQGSQPLSNSVLDADFFLTTALSLGSGKPVPNFTTGPQGAVVAQRVASAFEAVQSFALQEIDLFGSNRLVDFSQFQPRGHYTDTEALQRYFQAMMWCSLIDLRVATFPPNNEDDERELGTTIILDYLLQKSGQYETWTTVDQILRAFMGVPESMTFPQLESLLAANDINSPAGVANFQTLTNLRTQLLTGELGMETIRGGVFFYDPFSGELPKLPRSFALFSQRFTMDAWAFSEVTWPSTVAMRRRPSCLDAAFSVFGNDAVAPEIVARMSQEGAPYRDGLPYQINLAAVRKVIDNQNSTAWTSSIYTAWLAAIRALSAPTTSSSYPEAMRTHAWAMKNLNTQLASWTELKHDTVLYETQPYTDDILCDYPYGFVEPRPDFWGAMNALSASTADAIAGLSSIYGTPDARYACLTNFSAWMLVLQDMAERELAQQPFTAQETNAILDLIEPPESYVSWPTYSGWYPTLFYETASISSDFVPFWALDKLEGCDKWDPVVTDVQTDPPDPDIGDPGAVLNEATGNINLLMIAVDNGPDRRVYAGPVMSQYEFEMEGTTRLTDTNWASQLQAAEQPPPDWTSSYLVPQ